MASLRPYLDQEGLDDQEYILSGVPTWIKGGIWLPMPRDKIVVPNFYLSSPLLYVSISVFRTCNLYVFMEGKWPHMLLYIVILVIK